MTDSDGSSGRLDRLEAFMAQQAEQLAVTRQLVESNARAIEANSNEAARQRAEAEQQRVEFRAEAERQRAELHANITDVVSMITASADQAEIDRAEFRATVRQLADQAEIDRAEFRATVRQLLEVLTQRFTSNGH
jgi:hypothetical protein